MNKLLIENLATVLGMDPNNLSAREHRKLAIIIDWALEINELKKNNEYQMFSTQLLSNKNELSDIELNDLLILLRDTHAKGVFGKLDTLDNPDLDDMEEMLQKLCVIMGISTEVIHQQYGSAGIKEYEKTLLQNIRAYSEKLEYHRYLSSTLLALSEASQQLQSHYEPLFDLNFFTFQNKEKNWFSFNSGRNCVELNHADRLIPNQNSNTPHEKELVMFYLRTLRIMLDLNKKSGWQLANEASKFVCDQLAFFLKKVNIPTISFEEAKEIEALLKKSQVELPKNNDSKKTISELVSEFIMNNKALRTWSTPNDLLPENRPINRVILFGAEDINDEEIFCAINLMINKHPNENIAVTCHPEDIRAVDKKNAMLSNTFFTLQVIGHGTFGDPATINANLGPYRGLASDTGKQVALLVNECLHINHVRISSCFSGIVDANAPLKGNMVEKEQAIIAGMRTLTLTTDSQLDNNQPFLANSAALSCWNNIKKDAREISMTVSPGIIEPDPARGHLTWRKGVAEERADDQVKEIRVTTSNGPKIRPR